MTNRVSGWACCSRTAIVTRLHSTSKGRLRSSLATRRCIVNLDTLCGAAVRRVRRTTKSKTPFSHPQPAYRQRLRSLELDPIDERIREALASLAHADGK